ncbi:MAG: amino acid kinase family protein [Promethearchaeota archaeon]
MKYKEAVFKIGGKILENSNNIESTFSQLAQLFEKEILQKIIIIPGGGSFANFVRSLDEVLHIGDDLAHWIAIYSMNYNGIMLNRKYPDLENIEKLKTFQNAKQIFCIFLPYSFLREDDTLPHNWDVTSDSIALYVANKLKLSQCFLIKNIDGIFNIDKELIKSISTFKYSELKSSNQLANIIEDDSNVKKSKPIDPYLLKLIEKYKTPCYILNGRPNNRRIVEFFNSAVPDEKKIYTKIGSQIEL